MADKKETEEQTNPGCTKCFYYRHDKITILTQPPTYVEHFCTNPQNKNTKNLFHNGTMVRDGFCREINQHLTCRSWTSND